MYMEPFAEWILDESSVDVRKPRFFTNSSVDFVAGLIGGCAGLAFGHPFDTIKVRQQTNTTGRIGVVHCLKHTLANEGVRGLFKGMAFPLVSVGFMNSIFFGVYGNSIRLLSKDEIKPSYGAIFIAGGFAGAIQGIPACAVEQVKVKLQAQNSGKIYKGPLDCLSGIYGRYGIRGCFRGLTPTILRELPGFSIYITSYTYLCDRMTRIEEEGCSIPAMLMAGGLAGMLSWMVNIPIDIIKSRLQADDLARPKYRGMWHCAMLSYKQEGWRVFWRGLPVTCMRAFPTNAVTFAVYSSVLKHIKQYIPQPHEEDCY